MKTWISVILATITIALGAVTPVFMSWGCASAQSQKVAGDRQQSPEPSIVTTPSSAKDNIASTPESSIVDPATGHQAVSNEVDPSQEGVNKPEEGELVASSRPDASFLYAGGTKWARVGVGLTSNPGDDLAQLGYQEITFLPNGTYEWEGWILFTNFKKLGRYELRGPDIYMRDTEVLWMRDDKNKAVDIKDLIWNDETYAKYRVEGELGPVLEVLAGGNWVYMANYRYDWKRHRVVDQYDEIVPIPK